MYAGDLIYYALMNKMSYHYISSFFNMFLTKVLDSRTGQIAISAVLGFGLAIIFSRACVGRSCIIVRGPPPMSVEDKVYQFNKDCYQFTHHQTSCSNETEQKKPVERLETIVEEPSMS